MKYRVFVGVLAIVVLALLAIPLLAQDAEPVVVPVTGTFDFVPESYATFKVADRVFKDAYEEEVWFGDIVGTATAPFRVSINPDGTIHAWLMAEFEGTVKDEYEGTMVMLSLYTRHSSSTHWAGEWIILSGTGDFENVQGYGTAWGPGHVADDPEGDPDIYYSGHLVFPAGG